MNVEKKLKELAKCVEIQISWSIEYQEQTIIKLSRKGGIKIDVQDCYM